MARSVGELNWGGAAGTYFWADPKEELFAVMMIQSFAQRVRYRNMVKTLERLGLITRAPRQARSIAVAVPEDELPRLRQPIKSSGAEY